MHAIESNYQSMLLPGIAFVKASNYTLVVRTCFRTEDRNASKNSKNSRVVAVKR